MAREIPANMMNAEYKKLAYDSMLGGAMEAAARDYKKEVLADMAAEAEALRNKQTVDMNKVDELDLDDEDDDEMAMLQRKRMIRLRNKAIKTQELRAKGHGEYREIDEEVFLKEVTASKHVVMHFYHPEFVRCKVVDKHLTVIAKKYLAVKFVKINADKAPFFVTKLQIKTLPCMVCFVDGVAKDRVVGFDELGGIDDFPMRNLELRFQKANMLKYKARMEDSDSEEEEENKIKSLRSGIEHSDDEDDW